MKILKLLALVLILFVSQVKAQICQASFIADTLVKTAQKGTPDATQAGSCASPDGVMLQTAITPPDYNWLNTNGYCFTFPKTKNFTMCFTFTATGSSINLNSGYSSTGCLVINFSGFNLYKCSPSCALQGTGLSFSGLTVGQCYTWCFTGQCIGGGPTAGFTSVCPYFMDVSSMPIELTYFTCTPTPNQITLNWQTLTETNNKEFIIERSSDGQKYTSIGKIITDGKNSLIKKEYSFEDLFPIHGVNYYRLKQVDFNGQNKCYDAQACFFDGDSPTTEYYTPEGKKVVNPSNGLFIEKLTNNNGVRYRQVVK